MANDRKASAKPACKFQDAYRALLDHTILRCDEAIQIIGRARRRFLEAQARLEKIQSYDAAVREEKQLALLESVLALHSPTALISGHLFMLGESALLNKAKSPVRRNR